MSLRTTGLKGETVQSAEEERRGEKARSQVEDAGLSLKCRKCWEMGGSDSRRSVLGKDDSGVTREKMNLGEEEEIEMR